MPIPSIHCRRSAAGRRSRKVPFVVASSLLSDETASLAHLALPAAHDLESWGDSDFHPDILSVQQPVLRPLFQARQSEESLLAWLEQAERPGPQLSRVSEAALEERSLPAERGFRGLPAILGGGAPRRVHRLEGDACAGHSALDSRGRGCSRRNAARKWNQAST